MKSARLRRVAHALLAGEFDRAVRSVKNTLTKMDENWMDDDEWKFVYERVQALQEFFDAIDSLSKAVIRLDKLGLSNVDKDFRCIEIILYMLTTPSPAQERKENQNENRSYWCFQLFR